MQQDIKHVWIYLRLPIYHQTFVSDPNCSKLECCVHTCLFCSGFNFCRRTKLRIDGHLLIDGGSQKILTTFDREIWWSNLSFFAKTVTLDLKIKFHMQLTVRCSYSYNRIYLTMTSLTCMIYGLDFFVKYRKFI